MPTPAPQPEPARTGARRGFHLPGRQPFAIKTQARSHDEVLHSFGEYALFVLMWTLLDHEAGRVARCSRCATTTGTGTSEHDALIFETFKQSPENICPNCYGTTFEGGWKAKIVRPAIWDYQEERWDKGKRGYAVNLEGSLQTTNDFHLADGDYAFRADGTRWKIAGGSTDRIHDGFGLPTRADSNLGYSYATVIREDEAAASYSIPPATATELRALLEQVGRHFPVDTSGVDQVRGPLLPEHNEHTPIDYRPLDRLPGPPDGAF
jgi:hypothetical protein